MEKSDMRLLQKAQKYHDEGKSILEDHNKGLDHWNGCIHNFKKSLTLRESVLGRYHILTAQSYAALGSVYAQFGDPRAIVAYRTCYRINSFLYGKCNGPITSNFKDVLLKRGLDQSSIDEIQRDILGSMQFEIEGDLLRPFASRKAAIIEYKEAAKLEETAFGRDNPDLAFLWRKMAVLCSVRKGMIRSIDFGSADRMNQKWMKGFETSLFEPVCGAIQRGDMFYEDLLFDHAVGEYVNAMHIGMRCSEDEGEISSFAKPKPRSSNSQVPKRSQSYDSNIVHDLRQLLYGKCNKKDGAQSSHPSTTQAQEWNEHSTHRPAEPLSPVKKENPTEESVLFETERLDDSKLEDNSEPGSESTPIRSGSSRPIPLRKTKVKEEISPATIEKTQQDSIRRKPKKQKSANALTSKSSHSRRRRADSDNKTKPSSESALMVGSNMESPRYLGKQHSMPSLSRSGSKQVKNSDPESESTPIRSGSLRAIPL